MVLWLRQSHQVKNHWEQPTADRSREGLRYILQTGVPTKLKRRYVEAVTFHAEYLLLSNTARYLGLVLLNLWTNTPGTDVEGFITPEPHSTMLATAIEPGLIGIALMFAFASLGLLRSIQCVRNSPSLIGLSAAWFTVIVFSLAHTIQFSTYASTLIIILTTLTLGLTQKTQKAS